ncbi:MAG: hypothetical protein AB8B91_00035 [Rubripirellula sp.]
MKDRLQQLCFLPPPAGQLWAGPPMRSHAQTIARSDGTNVRVELPLFWYNPPWHEVALETADLIASNVAELGVTVSSLRSDLARPDETPTLHATAADDGSPIRLPRMVPYRPERYGLSDLDFDGAKIIDVRLAVGRDDSGRFAYSPEQIERWEDTPASEPLAGGGWVAAATFPPDVISLQHLTSKLGQLRALSPEAAVLVSISPHRLHSEIPSVLANEPDGLIIRMNDLDLSGLQLARLTQHARVICREAGHPDLPLWIAPGQVTAEDAVKLLQLGASAVAIDHWGHEFIDAANQQSGQSSLGGYSTGVGQSFVYDWIDHELAPQVERVQGLLHSTERLPAGSRLASLSPKWSSTLGIPMLESIDFD